MTTKLIYEPTVTLMSRPHYIVPVSPVMAWNPGDSARVGGGPLLVEFGGRACYQSFANHSGKSNAEYIANITALRHGSVLEHANYSVYVEGVSRSLTHELVRHRAGLAYSQLSQRYVDESDVAFVVPPAFIGKDYLLRIFETACEAATANYGKLIAMLTHEESYAAEPDMTSKKKRAREAARSVLPNATETKLLVTGNMRAWRHVLEMRGSQYADAEIRRWAVAVFTALNAEAPAFFQDFELVAPGEIVVGHSKV